MLFCLEPALGLENMSMIIDGIVETLFERNGLDPDDISFSGEASDADVSLLVCNHTEFAG
jgi:hypothetical protein